MRVDICRDGFLIGVARVTTECETTWIDGDCFVGVSLEQTCRQKQANFDVGNLKRRNFEESQVSKVIVDCPNDSALPFDLETFGNALELCDGSWQRDWTLEVVEVGRGGNGCA